jgi:hypothetical protein
MVASMKPKDAFEWNLFDHKWNNLKRWVELCEEKFGKEGPIAVGRMGDMMRFIEEGHKHFDDEILKRFA